MRVRDLEDDVNVTLTWDTKLFGKIRGESGKEWAKPNAQATGGN